MDVNVASPINCLGYGVVGLNIVLGLERLGHAPALWPIGEIEAPEEHHLGLQDLLFVPSRWAAECSAVLR